MNDIEAASILKVETLEKGGGNTNSPPDKPKKQEVQAKLWCFTLNNYGGGAIETMIKVLQPKDKYIIGKEVGDEGTPHLQGFINFYTKKRMSQLKKLHPSQIHWEKCKGTQLQNVQYCSKGGDYVTNIPMPRKLTWPEWYPWQMNIIKLLSTVPDDRKINWYYERSGNIGKTTLTKYLCAEKKALLLPPKKTDAFYQIAKEFENSGVIDICIFDVPRESQGYISYSAIEKIKDGCVSSGKYEGCQCIFPSPHVIVFANRPPDYEALSGDRWNVVNLDSCKTALSAIMHVDELPPSVG